MLVRAFILNVFIVQSVLCTNLNSSEIENVTVTKSYHSGHLKRYIHEQESLLGLDFVNNTGNDAVKYANNVDFDELTNIWNPKSVAQLWTKRNQEDINISKDCRVDITRYMTGVSTGVDWAIKMMDATGQPPWGLLEGNRFWMGCPEQCRELERNLRDSQMKDEMLLLGNDLPPFHVNPVVVHFDLEIFKPGIKGVHNITLGLCLPMRCSAYDVGRLLDFVQNQTRQDLPRRVSITYIKNLAISLSLWENNTFCVLMIILGVVITFVIIGTSYDIVLRYRVLRKEQIQRRVNNNVITEMKILRHHHELKDFHEEITMAKLWSLKTHNASLDVSNSKDIPKPLSEALLSFSLLVNIYKVFSLQVGEDTLSPIHGLRFFTMLWVILIHTCLLLNEFSGALAIFSIHLSTWKENLQNSYMFKKRAEKDFLYQTVGNGTYAVDTFFCISGCLVSFLYFRTMAKTKIQEKKITKGLLGRFFQFLGMMFYRYFRLTPLYAVFLFFVSVVRIHFHNTKMLDITSMRPTNCQDYWWRNILYINTYFAMEDRCMTWSWYLANDTQFYTIGIIILIIGASYLSISVLLTVSILIASWIITAIITFNLKHVPSIEEPFAHYDSLYDKPWSRIGPYVIGMITGWYLFKTKCRIHMNRGVVTIGWTLSITTMGCIVYGLYGQTFGPIMSALYTALSHSGWAACVAWVLIACVTDNGGLINKILSWKYIYPFSRLSYCVYLLHPEIMRSVIVYGDSPMHATVGLATIIFPGLAVVSFIIGLIFSLLFEAPMVSLLRIIHPMRSWKHQV